MIRYAPNADLEGVSVGEPIRWHVPAERFAKTVSDRLLAQHYNSWKVRTVTGLDRPETDSEALEQKAKLSNDTILTGGEGVQFGTLDETPLDGFLKAEAADLATIAALAQKPVWALSGSQLVNLSADAIAEARSSERQKSKPYSAPWAAATASYCASPPTSRAALPTPPIFPYASPGKTLRLAPSPSLPTR